MTTTLLGAAQKSSAVSAVDVLYVVLGLVLLAVVLWGVVDVARRPTSVLSGGRKTAWIAGMVGGTFLLGIVGPVVAGIYLAVIRPRLARTPPGGSPGGGPPPGLPPLDGWG